MGIDINDLKYEDVISSENLINRLFESSGIGYAEGSALSELLVKPAAAIHAWQREQSLNIIKNLDIYSIANGSIEGDDDLLDALASTYRIKRADKRASTGSIVIYLTANQPTYINSRYSFSIGPAILSIEGIYVGVPSLKGYNNTPDITYTQIRKNAEGRYYIVVPVIDSSGSTFSSGHRVDYEGNITEIEEVYVFSDITGGEEREDNKSLAARILQGLSPGVLSTPVQIRGAFQEVFGVHPTRVKVFGTMDREMRRAIDPITYLPLPGCVDVVVLPSYGIVTEEHTINAVREGAEYVISLGSDLVSGAYTINLLEIEGVAMPSTVDVVWGLEEGSSHRIRDGRYTAYQTCDLVFTASTSEPSLSCLIKITKAKDIALMQTYIDSSDKRAPGQDTLVRAAIPCLVRGHITVDSKGMPKEDIQRSIVDGINTMPIGTGKITGQDIINFLPENVELVFPFSLTGEVILPETTKTFRAAQGALIIPDLIDRGQAFTAKEVGFHTSANNITVGIND